VKTPNETNIQDNYNDIMQNTKTIIPNSAVWLFHIIDYFKGACMATNAVEFFLILYNA
jgi:hypothetical protein